MREITTLAIDLAKRVFQLHGVDARGVCVLRKQLQRAQLLSFLAQLPVCLVAMEACGGAHHWGRHIAALGHRVKLIAPQYVKPFVRGDKTDRNDAQGICEAALRPGMPEVAVKSEMLDAVVDAITSKAKTGQIGDGKIFVTPLEQVVRIRTGETDGDAL